MIRRATWPVPPRRRQHGAIAVIAAISLLAMAAVAGLVVDAGRLFVIKSELQNAADACALAAAREMDGGPDSLLRAARAGVTVCRQNYVDFQDRQVAAVEADISFAEQREGPYLSSAGADPARVRYVRCRPEISNPNPIRPYFMGVFGVSGSFVNAEAVARLASSQSNCAFPAALCTAQTSRNSPAPNWGFTRGQWYQGNYAPGSGMTGNFGWVDFTPPHGGASELADLVSRGGACNVRLADRIGSTGVTSSLTSAWNTRFGLYKGNFSPETHRPDRSGFAYTETSWPSRENAYPDLVAKRRSNTPFQGEAAAGISVEGGARTATQTEHQRFGADRRLVIMPIVTCSEFNTSQTAQMRDWACTMLLNPIGRPEDARLEFLGLTSEPGSPCATTGLPGSQTSEGPVVPTLVQ